MAYQNLFGRLAKNDMSDTPTNAPGEENQPPPGAFSQQVQHASVSARVPEKIGRGVFSTGALCFRDRTSSPSISCCAWPIRSRCRFFGNAGLPKLNGRCPGDVPDLPPTCLSPTCSSPSLSDRLAPRPGGHFILPGSGAMAEGFQDDRTQWSTPHPFLS